MLLRYFRSYTLVVSSIPATPLATYACCLWWELYIHSKTIVESHQKLQIFIFISCNLTSCSVKPHCTNCLLQFQACHQKLSHRFPSAFTINNCMVSWVFFCLWTQKAHCTHRVFRFVSKYMKLGLIHSCIEVSSFDAIFSAKIGSCSLHLRNSAYSAGSTSFSQCCLFLFQMLLRNLLLWTLSGANNSTGQFIWVLGVSTSLFLPQRTWSLSSVTVNCSPSIEDPNMFVSISKCFVLLSNFKSSVIASLTA